MLKSILIALGVAFLALVWYGVQLDYNDYRARDRDAGYELPEWSYWEAVIRVIKGIFRIK